MEAGSKKRSRTAVGLLGIPMFLLPLSFIAMVLMFDTSSDGTCIVNRPPCGELEQMGLWVPVLVFSIVIVAFGVWGFRGVTGTKDRRRSLAAGTSPVVARLLAVGSTGGSVDRFAFLDLEIELPGGAVVADELRIPHYLLNQLRPGDEVPVLLSADGHYFELDEETMSRVQPLAV